MTREPSPCQLLSAQGGEIQISDFVVTLSQFGGPVFRLDHSIQAWFLQARTPGLVQFFNYITCLGSPQVLAALGCLVLIYCLLNKRAVEGLVLNIGLLASWAAVDLLKLLFGRSRPEGETFTFAAGFSFPSGHAMLSLVFYGFVAYWAVKRWPGKKGRCLMLALYLTVLLIGISRVYLNVHYASDVLAGYFAGGFSLLLFIKLLNRARVPADSSP